jgi:hypothetical protein
MKKVHNGCFYVNDTAANDDLCQSVMASYINQLKAEAQRKQDIREGRIPAPDVSWGSFNISDRHWFTLTHTRLILMYRLASSLITKRTQFVHDKVNIALPAYVQAACERKSANGYSGFANPDHNRYSHEPNAKRTVSPEIVWQLNNYSNLLSCKVGQKNVTVDHTMSSQNMSTASQSLTKLKMTSQENLSQDSYKEFKIVKLKAVKPRKAQLHFTKGH